MTYFPRKIPLVKGDFHREYGVWIVGSRHIKLEGIILTLRGAEIKLAAGKVTGEVCRALVSKQSDIVVDNCRLACGDEKVSHLPFSLEFEMKRSKRVRTNHAHFQVFRSKRSTEVETTFGCIFIRQYLDKHSGSRVS